MAYRSWLDDVKRVEDLGSHLIEVGWPHPDWEKCDDRATERWLVKLREPLPVAPEDAEFFGTGLYYSWMTKISRTGKTIELKVHNFLAQVFVEDLAELAGIPEPQILCPVHLVFEDVAYANGYRADRSRHLRHSDWLGDYAFSFDFSSSAKFWRDWFFQEDNRLQWIASLDVPLKKPIRNVDPNELYVAIDCANATALDLREPALSKHFPPIAMQFWQDMINGIDLPERGIDHTGGPLEYVLQNLKKYNLTNDQLAKSIKDFRASNP